MEFGVVASLFVKHTGLSPDRTFCVFVWGLMTKPTRWRLFFFLFFLVTHPVTWTQSTLPLLPPPSSLHVNICVVDGMMQWVKVPCLLFFVFFCFLCVTVFCFLGSWWLKGFTLCQMTELSLFSFTSARAVFEEKCTTFSYPEVFFIYFQT